MTKQEQINMLGRIRDKVVDSYIRRETHTMYETQEHFEMLNDFNVLINSLKNDVAQTKSLTEKITEILQDNFNLWNMEV